MNQPMLGSKAIDHSYIKHINQHKLGIKSALEHLFMLSNKVRTGETQSHQIIIDSGASSITLNSTWKDAIQNITSTNESVLTANGIVNDMIVGQGYINVLGIQFQCKYAPKIHNTISTRYHNRISP